MKRTLFIVGFLLLIPSVLAGLRVDVIQYNPDTQKARIMVSNTGPGDYTEITFALDDMPAMTFQGSLLKAGTAVTIPKIVPQGTHRITVTTREGEVFSNDILFGSSGRQIVEQNVRIASPTQTPASVPLPDEQVSVEHSGFPWTLLIIIILVVLCIATFLYLRVNPKSMEKVKGFFARFRKSQKPVQQRPMQRPVQMQRQAYASRYPGYPQQRGPTRPVGPVMRRGR